MKRIYLFPNRLKLPALVVFVISMILIILQISGYEIVINATVFAFISDSFGAKKVTFGFVEQNIYDEILNCAFFISGAILAFSKEKIEDEIITFLRFKSLVYAVYCMLSLLILSEIFIYGMSFLTFLVVYFYAFVIFLNIFYYSKLFIYKKQFSHENED